jgi:5-carboxymethyl-2-hydroxymuconate isomerase
MPHIIVENSHNFAKNNIFDFGQKIIKTMSELEGNFDLEQCKFRNLAFDNYFVGSSKEDSSSFIHITIKIMSGRSDEIKNNLAVKVFALAKDFFNSQNSQQRFDISVDIVDMDRNSYQKITITS